MTKTTKVIVLIGTTLVSLTAGYLAVNRFPADAVIAIVLGFLGLSFLGDHVLTRLRANQPWRVLSIVVAIVVVPVIGYVSVTTGQSKPIELAVAMGVILATAHLCSLVSMTKWVIVWYCAAVWLALVAISGDPIDGARRWVQLGEWNINVALVLAPASVFILCSAPSDHWSGLAGLAGIVLLILTGSFTVAAIVAVSCAFCLLAHRCWPQLFVAGTVILLYAVIPLSTNRNRLIRIVEFASSQTIPYQLEQGRSCLRSTRFVGTSEAITYHLPAANDDLAILDAMRRGGAVAGLFTAMGSLLALLSILGCMRWTGSVAASLGIGAISLYSCLMLANLLSNLTIIPTLGVSSPFVGRGLNNMVISGVLVGSQFATSLRPSKATSDNFLWCVPITLVVIVAMSIVALGLCPLWVPILF